MKPGSWQRQESPVRWFSGARQSQGDWNDFWPNDIHSILKYEMLYRNQIPRNITKIANPSIFKIAPPIPAWTVFTIHFRIVKAKIPYGVPTSRPGPSVFSQVRSHTCAQSTPTTPANLMESASDRKKRALEQLHATYGAPSAKVAKTNGAPEAGSATIAAPSQHCL